MSLPLIQEIRAIKTKEEISSIVAAQKISEEVLKEIVKKLKVGVSEKQIVACIEKGMRKRGVSVFPFKPIVAFGKGTADVHHVPGETKLKKGNLITMDFGATVSGYCSDMTRSFIFSKPGVKEKKVYEAVHQSMEKVLAAISKGQRNTFVLDGIARKHLYVTFGKKSFPHALGHGLGTVIHEWPTISPRSKEVLKPGMVVTIEPGVYLKGWGGVRIEDMILITKNGYKNLTSVSRKFEDSILNKEN